MQNNNSKTLLAVYAHPDDESFGSGGMLAHYAAQGVRVGLVTATRGEIGEIADSGLATSDNLGDVREQELRNAADALGITDLEILENHLENVLLETRCLVMTKPGVLVPNIWDKFDSNGRLHDDGTRAVLEGHMDAFKQWILRVGTKREAVAS